MALVHGTGQSVATEDKELTNSQYQKPIVSNEFHIRLRQPKGQPPRIGGGGFDSWGLGKISPTGLGRAQGVL